MARKGRWVKCECKENVVTMNRLGRNAKKVVCECGKVHYR